MEKYKLAVYSFIDKMKYLENDRVLGVIVYGSYITGYNHEKSNIDMHIILDDKDDELYIEDLSKVFFYVIMNMSRKLA